MIGPIAEVGVVLLLFAIGLELSLSRIVRMGAWVFRGGSLQVGATILARATQTTEVGRLATLTPFLPAPGKATGAAVIVAPGGGYRWLSMGNEGWEVAQALAEKGIAAFVLKYRLHQTPESLDEFKAWMNRPRSAPAASHVRARSELSVPRTPPRCALPHAAEPTASHAPVPDAG